MRGRLKPLAWLAVAALLLHAAALGGLQWTWPQRVAPPWLADALRVRVVEADPVRDAAIAAVQVGAPATAVSPAAVPVKAAPPAGAQPALRRPAGPRAGAAAKSPTAGSALTTPAPLLAMADPSAEVVLPPRLASPAVSVQTPAGTPAVGGAAHEPGSLADATIPHYRTQMPPAALPRYELQRGGQRGSGELLFRPDGERYALQLEGRVGPLAVLTQVSTGGFDAAGQAPLRFTGRRLHRPTSAANFQRDAGKLTFSGPATEFASSSRPSWRPSRRCARPGRRS
jgi:hypothetical protein